MRIADLAQRPSDGRPAAGRTAFDKKEVLLEWGGVGQNFLAESRSRLYPHMRAKFGRDPTAMSKKVPFNFISRLLSESQNIWNVSISVCSFLLSLHTLISFNIF